MDLIAASTALTTGIQALLDEKNTSDNNYQTQIADLVKQIQQPLPVKSRLGVNTHLFSDPSYSDIDRVINRLNVLKVNYIRQDFDVDINGKMLQHDLWINKLKPKLDEAGIHVRAMVYLRGEGFIVYQNFCKLYDFDEIEIGNENAIRSLIKGRNGDVIADYDLVKLKADCTYIQQAYLGILSTPRSIKIFISITWVHFYYNDLLRRMGVNTFLSLHSYSDGIWNVGSLPAYKGKTSWQAAKDKYGDMLIEFGETNFFPTDKTPYNDDMQKERLGRILTEFHTIDKYIFELFDRVNSKGKEDTFGLFRSDGSAKPSVDLFRTTNY